MRAGPVADDSLPRVGDAYITARTEGRHFQVYREGEWASTSIVGVNVGSSLPGRWFTEFPADMELYRRWLEQISSLNINVIRLYTLMDPLFYQALHEFNRDEPGSRLWLIQGIWPHEDVPDDNLFDPGYMAQYEREIATVIDALHGRARIQPRPYRAHGRYTSNVAQYVLGLTVGRELLPHEVAATNELNPGVNEHRGAYVRAEGASPTEVWLAAMCDHAAEHAHKTFGWQHPVGFVSWPTLDPLHHPTEWDPDGNPGADDQEEVDPSHIIPGPANHAGLFGAYHIYPNYPDFMNHEPAFSAFSDEEGVFRYRGYLNRFMAIHPPYPAIVAEFGMSSSLNTAHVSPDGLHHGGISEVEQGLMVVRMLRALLAEGYAGGIVFEWHDEWAKGTWNTEPYMVPYDRQVLWKNAMDPEQNYGLLAVEPDSQPFAARERMVWTAEAGPASPAGDGSDALRTIRTLFVDSDEAFLYLALEVEGLDPTGSGRIPWELVGVMVGIDTYGRAAGEHRLPVDGVPPLPTGIEFLLHIVSPDDASLLVIPPYNRADHRFASDRPLYGGEFMRIQPLVNRQRVAADGTIFPPLFSDESRLVYGRFLPGGPDFDPTAHWWADPDTNRIYVRLPWMLLGVSDPSSNLVIHDPRDYTDPPARDHLSTRETEGFVFYAATYFPGHDGKPVAVDYQPRRQMAFATSRPYLWDAWNAPSYRFRLKESVPIIARFLAGEYHRGRP